MKIKNEHAFKTLTIKDRTFILGELSRTQVKQFLAAGYIQEGYVEKPKKRTKKKDEGDIQGTMVERNDNEA